MSTKIYNGIKFKTNSFQKVYEQLLQLRPKFIENANKALDLQYIEMAEMLKRNPKRYEEVIKLCKESKDTDYVIDMIGCMLQFELMRNLDKKNRDFFDPNYESSIVIIPYKKSLYGLYYCDRIKENEDLVFSIADDYHYQNQTDKPDDISYREWHKREEVWENILDSGGYCPSEFGFIFKITTDTDIKISDELARKVYDIIMANK